MASTKPTLQEIERHRDQLKAELDEVNPRLNRTLSQLTASENGRLLAEQELAKVRGSAQALSAERDRLAQVVTELQGRLREAAAQIQAGQQQTKLTMAQRDVAVRRDARARQLLSGLGKSITDFLQGAQAADEVAGATANSGSNG